MQPHELLAKDDRTYEKVPCPEWGTELWVRSLDADERDEYEASLTKYKKVKSKGKVKREASLDARSFRAKLVIRAVCAGEGNPTRFFADADLEKLGKKNAIVVDRLFSVAQKLSGLTDEDVEEITGNLTPD